MLEPKGVAFAAGFPKGVELAVGFPKGELETAGFCCADVPEGDPKVEAPIVELVLPNPEDGVDVGADEEDPRLPKPEEEENPLVGFGGSCKGFGTLYLAASF